MFSRGEVYVFGVVLALGGLALLLGGAPLAGGIVTVAGVALMWRTA
jgi:hypothetical protein